MDDTQQEMTLEQWVNRLPAFHLAHKEYDQLQAKVKELEAENKRVREACLKAIRDYRNYRKIDPEAFQVWSCSERKGAMLLARRLCRVIHSPNSKSKHHSTEQVPTTGEVK